MRTVASKRLLPAALGLLLLLGVGAGVLRWRSAPPLTPRERLATMGISSADLDKIELVAEPGERAGNDSHGLIDLDTYLGSRYTYPAGRADRTWLVAAAKQDQQVRANVPAGQVTYSRANNPSPLALNPLQWTSIGPMPQESNTCAAPCFIFNEVAGRINDIVVDPISPTIAYIAPDGGGVWKTTNCCSPATTWVPVTSDPLVSTTAIGDLSIDPTNGTVYAGTGDLRFGSFSFGSAGLLKSTDRGTTWQIKGADVFGPYYPLPPGAFPQYNSIGKVEPDPAHPNTVIVGSKLGVYLSYNGGDTWTGPCLPDPYPSQRQDITALRVHTTMGITDLYVAVGARGISTTVQSNLGENGANGIYRSTVPSSGCPVSWSLLTRPDNGWPTGTGSGVPGYQPGGNVVGRIDMALAPSDPNVIYAQVQAVQTQESCGSASGCQLGIWRSTDAGATWQQRSTGDTLNQYGDSCGPVCLAIPSVCGDYPQNWYDQNIIVSPTNPDVVFFQTDDIWRSTDGGATMQDLTCGYGYLNSPPPAGVHVDNHAMAFMPGNPDVLLTGSDGGTYITLNANAQQPAFTNLNASLNTIEFYSGDITANFATDALPAAVAGAQDNGSGVWSGDPNNGPFLWQQRLGGDGMVARFDPITQRAYLESQNGNLNMFGPRATGQPVAVAGAWGSDRLSFVFPYEIYKGVPTGTPGGGEDCPLTGCLHMIGASQRVWETIQGGLPDGSSWYPNSGDLTKNTLGNRSFINQLAFAFRSDDLAIVGTNDGNVQVGRDLGQGTANTATWINVTGGNAVLPNRPILDVVFDPAVLTMTTGLIGYAAVGGFDQNTPGTPGHVYRLSCTANCASFTWTNRSGNLPNIPVDSITANPRYRQQVFAGTDWGVYYTNDIDAASPVWMRFSAGMPSVMVWDFAIDRGFTTLAAFTRSRGAWVWPLPAAPFAGTPVPTVTASPGPPNTAVVPPSYTPRPPATATRTFTPAPSPTPLGCGQTLLLSEGFESGTLGAFTSVPISGTLPWATDNTVRNSGIWSAHVFDPNELSDQRLEMTSAVAIPANAVQAQMQFYHRYSFENDQVPYDGAVLEYSTNSGATWADAGTLITEGNYNGIILAGANNPLGGRFGWTNVSTGYPTFSRVTVNLTSLAGQSVKLRFREGSDDNTGAPGWWVDDVTILVTNPCLSATPTTTPTLTPTPGARLVGHVVWQGRPAPPDPLNQLPITLTLRMGGTTMTYPNQMTDASGTFTVSVSTLPNGTYSWWAKGRMWLATSGTVNLTGASITQQDMGMQRAGDVDNSNLVDITDFSLLRSSFGAACGDPNFDERADWTGDCLVDITDFSLLRGNFGQAGPPPP